MESCFGNSGAKISYARKHSLKQVKTDKLS